MKYTPLGTFDAANIKHNALNFQVGLDMTSFEVVWAPAPGDTSQTSLYTMRDSLAKHNWEVILPGAAGQWTFVAYVASIDVSNLETSKQIVISVKLKITGKVTFA